MCVYICIYIHIQYIDTAQAWGVFLLLPPFFFKYHCSKILSSFNVIESANLCFSGDIQNLGSCLSRQDLEKFVPMLELKAPVSVS